MDQAKRSYSLQAGIIVNRGYLKKKQTVFKCRIFILRLHAIYYNL